MGSASGHRRVDMGEPVVRGLVGVGEADDGTLHADDQGPTLKPKWIATSTPPTRRERGVDGRHSAGEGSANLKLKPVGRRKACSSCGTRVVRQTCPLTHFMCYTAKIPKSDTPFISVVCFSFLVCFSCMRGTGGFARGLFRASDQSARGGAEHARVLGMALHHHFLAFRSPTSSVRGLTRACLSINNHGLLSCQTPNRIQPCTFGPASVLELWQLPQFAEKPAKPAHPALATCASYALRTEVGGSGPRLGSRCSSSESLRRSCCVAAQLFLPSRRARRARTDSDLDPSTSREVLEAPFHHNPLGT